MSAYRSELFPLLDNGAACAKITTFNRPGLESEDFKTRTARTKAAKAICVTCPVVEKCLRWALDHPTQAQGSIWGGKTDSERKKLKAAEKLAVRAALQDNRGGTDIVPAAPCDYNAATPVEAPHPPQTPADDVDGRPVVNIAVMVPLL